MPEVSINRSIGSVYYGTLCISPYGSSYIYYNVLLTSVYCIDCTFDLLLQCIMDEINKLLQ